MKSALGNGRRGFTLPGIEKILKYMFSVHLCNLFPTYLQPNLGSASQNWLSMIRLQFHKHLEKKKIITVAISICIEMHFPELKCTSFPL